MPAPTAIACGCLGIAVPRLARFDGDCGNEGREAESEPRFEGDEARGFPTEARREGVSLGVEADEEKDEWREAATSGVGSGRMWWAVACWTSDESRFEGEAGGVEAVSDRRDREGESEEGLYMAAAGEIDGSKKEEVRGSGPFRPP
jgi:hypothetical protein